MNRRRLAVVLSLLLIVGVVIVIVRQRPVEPDLPDGRIAPYAFALIGETPFGSAEAAAFPAVVRQLNADPQLAFVGHLGDIKDSRTPCTDAYLTRMSRELGKLTVPLLYTPGDNEWTDCHRPVNGSFHPLERLAKLREIYFNTPNTQLAAKTTGYYSYGAQNGYPENVRFSLNGVAFASVHIVGADNGLTPWGRSAAPSAEQRASVESRTAVAVGVIHDTFAAAAERADHAVVILTQADMFPANPAELTDRHRAAYRPIVAALAEESARSKVPVYLFNADRAIFRTGQPLAAARPFAKFYGVEPTDRLRRITLDGGPTHRMYLKVTVDPNVAEPLTWERIPEAR